MFELTPEHFHDSDDLALNLKCILCYNIAVRHIQFQFEETDEVLIQRKNISKDVMDDHHRC